MRNRETYEINLLRARIAKLWKELKHNPDPALKLRVEKEEEKLAIALEKKEADRNGI